MRGERTHARVLHDIKVIGQYKRACDAKFKEIYQGKNTHGLIVFFYFLYSRRMYIDKAEFYANWKSHKELKPLSEPATA